MQRRHRQAGFSMVELLVVLGITMVVAALAMPSIMDAVNDWKLRSTTSNLAAFFQRARINAVKSNQTTAICATTIGSGAGAKTGYYLETSGSCDSYASTKPTMILPDNMQHLSSVSSSLDQSQLGFEPQNATTIPSFNARGLPCVVESNTCRNFSSGKPVGFVYYIQDTRMLGTSGVAAVSVSPAGRIKAWTWNSKNSTWQ